MSESNENKSKKQNPMSALWAMATEGLLSVFSDKELTPDKRAGKKRKSSAKRSSGTSKEQPSSTSISKKETKRKRNP